MEHLFETPGGAWRRLPRYVALVPVLRRRRVLVLGLAGGEGVAFLAAGRARSVVVADRDADAMADGEGRLGGPGIECVTLEGDTLPFEDVSFDAVVALGSHGPASAGRLDEVRRVLSPDGVFAVSLDNPARRGLPVAGEDASPPGDGSGHALLVVLRGAFEHVRLVGQTPVVGFLFSDLGVPDGGRGAPRVEDELLGGALDETDAWLALCTDVAAASAFDPNLVRLPFDDLAGHLLEEASDRETRLRELAGRSEQAEGFQTRLDELEVALREAQSELEGVDDPADLLEVFEEALAAADAIDEEEPTAEESASPTPADRVGDPGRLAELEAAAAAERSRRRQLSDLVGELEEATREARAAGRRAEGELEELRRDHARLLVERDGRDERIAALEARLVRRRRRKAGPDGAG